MPPVSADPAYLAAYQAYLKAHEEQSERAEDGAAVMAFTMLAWQPEKDIDEPYDPESPSKVVLPPDTPP